MFDKITIIGLGLIGSSLARVIQQNGIAQKIIAADISAEVCETVKRLGIADAAMQDIRQSVVGSQIVVIATPLSAYEAVVHEIAPALKAGAVVIDVGSVKGAAIQKIKSLLPESAHFVPCHPIAGTEHSGPEAGFADLFDHRWCIITPTPDTDIKAVEVATKFWESCGARIEIMDPQHHDLILGITSHLPHLIAYTIVHTASELEDDIKSEVIKYSASGFRGFTRIAASDPVMWRDIFLNNKDAVLEILQRFTEDLTALQKAIRRGDGAYMFEVFSHTRDIRRQIKELGPEGFPAPEKMFRDLPEPEPGNRKIGA
jgi:cyclohexadieny/prephenate dehydrogenase